MADTPRATLQSVEMYGKNHLYAITIDGIDGNVIIGDHDGNGTIDSIDFADIRNNCLSEKGRIEKICKIFSKKEPPMSEEDCETYVNDSYNECLKLKEKYGASAQILVTQFREKLSAELLRVKSELDKMPAQTATSNQCQCVCGYYKAAPQEDAAREKKQNELRWYDDNNDGKTDEISFNTTSGVGVRITMIDTVPGEGCTNLDKGWSRGVRQYLRHFDVPKK